MKKFKRVLAAFAALGVLCCASAAWGNGLKAVYTYDEDELTTNSAGYLQIEEGREVKFIYTPSSYETSATIYFSDGSSGTMSLSNGVYNYSRTFSATGEIGININDSSYVASADVKTGVPFELYPAKMKMKPSESNRFVKFNSTKDANILNYSVAIEVSPSTLGQAAYQSAINPPRVTVSTNSTEGTMKVYVTIKRDSLEAKRVCTITVDKNSTESNMTYEGGGSSGGGGGCDAGLAGLMGFLALLPFAARRKAS